MGFDLIEILPSEGDSFFSWVKFSFLYGNVKWGLLLQTALTHKRIKLQCLARSTFVEKSEMNISLLLNLNFDHPKPRYDQTQVYVDIMPRWYIINIMTTKRIRQGAEKDGFSLSVSEQTKTRRM